MKCPYCGKDMLLMPNTVVYISDNEFIVGDFAYCDQCGLVERVKIPLDVKL